MREWLGAMNAAYALAGVDPDLCGAAAAAGLAEALLCGVTTVADHHLTWPAGADHRGMAEAVLAAAGELGARLVLVRGTAGDDPDVAAASADELAGIVRGDCVSLAVGPAGVHSDRPETFEALREVALRHGLPRRTQANEQVDVAVAAERYGRRPLELLADWGWLEPGVTVAHLCEITPAEVGAVAAVRGGRDARAGLRPADGLGPHARRRAARRRRGGRARHERRRLQRRRAPPGRRAPGHAGRAARRTAGHRARGAHDGDRAARPPASAAPTWATWSPARRPTSPCTTSPASRTPGSPRRSPGCSGPRPAGAPATSPWPAGSSCATASSPRLPRAPSPSGCTGGSRDRGDRGRRRSQRTSIPARAR